MIKTLTQPFISLLTRTFVLHVLALCAIACVPERLEDTPLGFLPNEAVLQSFMRNYPYAQRVEWNSRNDYYIADFSTHARPARAWFTSDGECVLYTVECTWETLNSNISAALTNGRFADWQRLNVRLLQRRDMTNIYKIALRKDDKVAHLFFAPTGNLIRVNLHVKDASDEPVTLSKTITQNLQLRFHQPEILDLWHNNSLTNTALIEDSVCKIASFNDNGEWTRTVSLIPQNSIPTTIIEHFKQSKQGAQAIIDETRLLQDKNGTAYLFYYSDNKGRHVATLIPSGSIKSIISYHD